MGKDHLGGAACDTTLIFHALDCGTSFKKGDSIAVVLLYEGNMSRDYSTNILYNLPSHSLDTLKVNLQAQRFTCKHCFFSVHLNFVNQ